MKSKLPKLAAAAVIIIAVLVGIPHIGGSSIALGDVHERVQQAQAFMYKMKMKMTGSMMPGAPPTNQDIQRTVIISNDYGMKMEMDMDMETEKGHCVLYAHRMLFACFSRLK